MGKKITTASALISLARAVDKKGRSFIYKTDISKRCMYFVKDDNGEWCADCIVGHVLADHGYNEYDLENYNGNSFGNVCNAIREIDITSGAKRILMEAQMTQDQTGHTWGEALDVAVAFADDYEMHGLWEPRS